MTIKCYILIRYNYDPDGKLWDEPGPVTINTRKESIECQVQKEPLSARGHSEWKMITTEIEV